MTRSARSVRTNRTCPCSGVMSPWILARCLTFSHGLSSYRFMMLTRANHFADRNDPDDRTAFGHCIMFLRFIGCESICSRRGRSFHAALNATNPYRLFQLALQSTFHRPLAYPDPYPPRPIFTRVRQPTPSEIEAGLDITTYETSFYKNAYSMVSFVRFGLSLIILSV